MFHCDSTKNPALTVRADVGARFRFAKTWWCRSDSAPLAESSIAGRIRALRPSVYETAELPLALRRGLWDDCATTLTSTWIRRECDISRGTSPDPEPMSARTTIGRG